MKDDKTIRVHRIGSMTFGIMLIMMGGLFLLHEVLPSISYEFIFRLWPIALILLGIEILLSIKMAQKYVYDKAAIVLMLIILFFSMIFAIISIGVKEKGFDERLYISCDVMED